MQGLFVTERNRSRRVAGAFLAAVLVTAAVFLATSSGSANASLSGTGVGVAAETATPQPSADGPGAPGTFNISGGAVGLYPGLTEPLVLTITNPQHFRIVVTSIRVRVGNASATCRAGNLKATGFSGSLAVRARGKAVLHTTISLLTGAPDGCQGVAFPLVYSGTATKDNP